MVFTKRLREGIRRGRIRCTIRIWTRKQVKVGGRYKMDDGHVVVDPHERYFGEAADRRHEDSCDAFVARIARQLAGQPLLQSERYALAAAIKVLGFDNGGLR